MLPILNVGPLAIQMPGLLLLAGVWLGSIAAEKEAQRRSVSAEAVTNLIFFGLLAGVVGARLGYALRFIPIYLENPVSLISLNPSTLSLAEGLLAGLITAVVYGQKRKLPFWPTLDSLTPGLAIFTIALGLSHLASGDAFGATSQVPWAIELWGARRHPTQLYETILAVAAWLAVLRLRQLNSFSGFIFWLWLAMISAAYLLVGAFRGDSVIVFQVLRQGQLLSFGGLLAGLIGLHLCARATPQTDAGNGAMSL
jgi:phosphatidylglycerol:prolipoprotein diacylglycerol transferase